MTSRLPTEHHLELLGLKETAQARLSLHLSKCHIVGNHMSRLNYVYAILITLYQPFLIKFIAWISVLVKDESVLN